MLKFPAICRLCSKKTELLYDLGDEKLNLIRKLASVAANTVLFNNLLPQKICQRCHDKLEETYQFQQQIYHIFKIYKSFMDYHQTLETIEAEGGKPEPFGYVDREYVSEDLRQFINRMSVTTVNITTTTATTTAATTVTKASSTKTPISLTFLKAVPPKKKCRKTVLPAVKRKRGRPRKYYGMMMTNDDLTDVHTMKNVVVNSVPKIDPDFEPEPYFEPESYFEPDSYFEEPVMINFRNKRAKSNNAEKENNNENVETFIITEQLFEDNEPGCSFQQDPDPSKGPSEITYWRTAL